MSTGQFNEFLRSMQRVFEDGISKGFVRGGQEIAGNLAYLAELGGGSELYKGEAGANVMQKLSGGIEGATSLSSVNDILIYQSAGKVIDKWKNAPKDSEEYQKFLSLGDIDPSRPGNEIDMTKISDWQQRSILMDRGFTPEVFDETMRSFSATDMKNAENVVGRIMSSFEMNNTQATYMYQNWDESGQNTLANYEKAMMLQSLNAPASGSTELTYQQLTQGFATELAKYGQGAFNVKVENMPELIDKMKEKINEDLGIGDRTPYTPADTRGMSENEAFAVRQSEYNEALKSRDHDRIERAAIESERARTVYMAPNDEIRKHIDREIQHKRAGNAGYGFFGQDKGDIASSFGLYSMLNNAISSNDETQIQQATTVMDIFDRAPRDIRDEWDRNNTLNSALADSRGIGDLLSALQKLITVTEQNGQVHYTFRQEE
jgi:hypothetical protein